MALPDLTFLEGPIVDLLRRFLNLGVGQSRVDNVGLLFLERICLDHPFFRFQNALFWRRFSLIFAEGLKQGIMYEPSSLLSCYLTHNSILFFFEKPHPLLR